MAYVFLESLQGWRVKRPYIRLLFSLCSSIFRHAQKHFSRVECGMTPKTKENILSGPQDRHQEFSLDIVTTPQCSPLRLSPAGHSLCYNPSDKQGSRRMRALSTVARGSRSARAALAYPGERRHGSKAWLIVSITMGSGFAYRYSRIVVAY